MGTVIYGRKGFKKGARVSVKRPIGATTCRQQYNQASCQPAPFQAGMSQLASAHRC